MDLTPSSEPVFGGTYRLLEQKLTSGTILKQTFSVFFTNVAAFGLICLLILIVPLGLQGWVIVRETWSTEQMSGADALLLILGALLSILLTPIATGALTYGVFQIVREREVTIGDCLSTGLQRLPSVLLVGLLVGLAVIGGFILCIIPGIIVAAILATAVPAAVIERPGIMGALRRSAALTDGFRWTAFGVFFSLGLLQILIGMALNLIQQSSPMLWFAGAAIQNVVFTGLQATAGALLYYHLRHEKESFDVEAIAQVFE